jgi:hypothetical protein
LLFFKFPDLIDMAGLTQIGTTNITDTPVELYSHFVDGLICHVGDIVEASGVERFVVAVGSNFVCRRKISTQKGVEDGSSQAHDFV